MGYGHPLQQDLDDQDPGIYVWILIIQVLHRNDHTVWYGSIILVSNNSETRIIKQSTSPTALSFTVGNKKPFGGAFLPWQQRFLAGHQLRSLPMNDAGLVDDLIDDVDFACQVVKRYFSLKPSNSSGANCSMS